jgi:transketolase
MQKAYISTLYELACKDKRIVSIIPDSGTDYDEMFSRDLPGQFYNMGIAEEHSVAAAAGMATCGKIPFIYTSGAFLAYRSYEFIRDDVCLQNCNVKIVGMGSGLAWSTLGPTHHTTEDISVLRAIPNLNVFSPATPIEVKKAVRMAYELEAPVYLRLGMKGEKEFYNEEDANCNDAYSILREGNDVVLITTGSILSEVMTAAELLESKGIQCGIINIFSIKPFPVDIIHEISLKAKCLISVEEHNTFGGLGGIISEILAERRTSSVLHRIGLNNCFAKGYGTLEEVRRQNKLDSSSICQSVCDFLNSK